MMEFCAVSTKGIAPRKRAFHSCSVVGDVLFIFGGIASDRTVLNDMYMYHISSNSWSRIEDRELCSSQSRPLVSSGFPQGRLCTAPSVSHHTATVVRGRFILIIGGWNGRKRCADVFCFDTVDQFWRHIPETGDIPVGLSSHTATLVSSKDILIIGREGGVHTQRRFAGAFYLNFETGKYSEAPFHASSRSGHTASLIPIRTSRENHLFVFGGRKNGGYELIGSWRKAEQTETSFPQHRIADLLEKSAICDEPSGRQHARAVELNNKHLLIFGGETWSGVRENVTNEAFVLETDTMKWYKLPLIGDAPKLVGHSMVGCGDQIFVFGGGLSNKYSDTLWEVKIKYH
ncbi:kelch domain-containing protein 9-like [Stylophora pistillata]|uniref:kelch domain-containing protein 9-like n=1 Tax=Stylophora pistillata TaxID=50429 RepID=UPI000C04BB35|nr:kelch domain-containing protein 9-like [Stylophora pistillata]